MDPVTGGLIALGIGQAVQLLLQLHNAVKRRHFKSHCGVCGMEYDSEHKDEKREEKEKEGQNQPVININVTHSRDNDESNSDK